MSYRKLNPENDDKITRNCIEAMSAIKVNIADQKMTPENLEHIQWSQTSISLSEFVKIYPLPQIVQIEEGYHGGSDENSLSMGQVMKIHTLTTERKVVCDDRHEKEIIIPVHTQKVHLKPPNHDMVYQRVSDLAQVKPLPKYVEVTRGYYNVDSNIDYELSVDPRETLEVVDVNETGIFTKKNNRSMTFRNSEGVEIKLPHDCVAGFKPLVDNTPHLLIDIIPSDSNDFAFPFHFQFDDDCASKMGVLKAKSSSDDKLIIASCGQGDHQFVFMISEDLKVKVKVAVGTLNEDPEYLSVMRNYHNFKALEVSLKGTDSFQKRGLTSSNSGVFGIQIPTSNGDIHHTRWETFDEESRNKDENDQLLQQSNDQQQNQQISYQHEHQTQKKHSLQLQQSPLYTQKQQQHQSFASNQQSQQQQQSFASNQQNQQHLHHQHHHHQQQQQQQQQQQLGNMKHNSTSVSDSSLVPIQPLVGNEIEKKLEMEKVTVDPLTEIKAMSVKELAEELNKLNMSKHADQFVENQVDGSLFCELEDVEFKDLGLNNFEIKKLERFKNGWRPKVE